MPFAGFRKSRATRPRLTISSRVMRAPWLVVLAGCGRLGFETQSTGIEGVDLVAHYKMETLGPGIGTGTAHQTIGDTTGVHVARCSMIEGFVHCPTSVPGQIGNALAFDGVDDIAIVQPTPALATTTGFTVTAWARLTGEE